MRAQPTSRAADGWGGGMPETTRCPLCLSEQAAGVLVCTVCNRDIAIPASLQAEHDDLLEKRDVLRDRIASVTARITALQSKSRSR